MVALKTILEHAAPDQTDVAAVMKYLDQLGQPQDVSDKPLPIIAPAVHQIHDDATSIASELGSKGQKGTPFGTLVGRKLDSITDCYVALAGVGPPADPLDAIRLQKEKDFARRLIGITYRLAQQTGYGKAAFDSPLLSADAQAKALGEIKSLQLANPLPDFAASFRMRRQATVAGLGGVIFFLLYLLLRFGIPFLIFLRQRP
jgi:hypothetical protein